MPHHGAKSHFSCWPESGLSTPPWNKSDSFSIWFPSKCLYFPLCWGALSCNSALFQGWTAAGAQRVPELQVPTPALPCSPITRSCLLKMRSSSCAYSHVYSLVPRCLLQLTAWDSPPCIGSSLTKPSLELESKPHPCG